MVKKAHPQTKRKLVFRSSPTALKIVLIVLILFSMVALLALQTASTSVPNAVIAETKTIDSTRGFKGVAVSYDAVVLSGSIPRLPEAWVTEGGLCLKNNHSIKFIKQ